MKNISFLFENFQFLGVKFSIYLNRHVCVMVSSDSVSRNHEGPDQCFIQIDSPWYKIQKVSAISSKKLRDYHQIWLAQSTNYKSSKSVEGHSPILVSLYIFE